MIDTLYQEGTDASINDMVARPAAPKPVYPGFWAGLGTAAPRGVAAGAAEGVAFGAETTGAFGQVLAATGADSASGMFSTQSENEKKQAALARAKMATEGVNFSNQAGDIFRQRAADLMPDPQSTGAAGQVVAGVAKFGAKAVAYTAGGNPFGAIPLALDEGMSEADRLKQSGVDLPARTKAGAVAGAVAGLSVVVPIAGTTAVRTAGLVGLAGPGGFIAQNAATRAILEHAGYDKIAEHYDPFDPTGLLVSTLVPAAFGTMAYRAGRPATAKPLDAVRTEADVRSAVQMTPAEQAHSDAFERSAQNIEVLKQAIVAEKDPANKAMLQTELDRQTKPGPGGVAEPVSAALQMKDGTEFSATRKFSGRYDFATPEGQPIGTIQYTNTPMGGHRVTGVDVRPEFQRKGVATAAYDFLENQVLNRPLEASGSQSEAGAAFRAARSNEMAVRDAIHADPDTVAAARVEQVSDIIDTMRLTHDGDIAGRDAHADAMELAHEQIARGEPVDVAHLLGDRPIDMARLDEMRSTIASAIDEHNRTLPVPKPEAAVDVKQQPPREAETPQAATVTTAETSGPAPSALDAQSAHIEALHPDLMVHLEGMDKPMRVADVMRSVRDQAANDVKETSLIQAAANCLLRNV